MANQRGISLIELIIFIMIMGILSAAILATFNVAGSKTPNIDKQIEALDYGQLRMDLILGQKATQGFNSFTDPCSGSSPPAVCNSPGFAVSSTIAQNWNGDTNYKVITVTVSGDASATLKTLVGDF